MKPIPVLVSDRKLACLEDLRVPYVLISITDPPPESSPVWAKANPNLLDFCAVSFLDVDPPRHDPALTLERYSGKTIGMMAMQFSHASMIWDTLRHHVEGSGAIPGAIVVQCEAGVSRSPSVAMAIVDALGWPRGCIQWAPGNHAPSRVPNAHVWRTTFGGACIAGVAVPPAGLSGGDVLAPLQEVRSWRLDRISPATYPPDLDAPAKRRGGKPAANGQASSLIRAGMVYRCRIGNGAYAYAGSPAEAVGQAVVAAPGTTAPGTTAPGGRS